MGVFIDPATDWGFKRIFGDKELLVNFLNSLLEGERGEWDYKLTPVYGVFFLDFLLDTEDSDYFCKDVSLVEKYTGKVFSNKLRHIYIELPRFMKSQADCDSFFDCWIYNLANMKQMKEISFKDRDAIFGRLEELASRGNMSKEERAQYDYEWKIYNDYLNTFNSAEKKAAEKGRAEGLAEGRAEEKLENARRMKSKGYPLDDIVDITGLTIEEIEKL